MNLFPTFRELGYGLGFSDRGQKPIASGHWEEVRPSFISPCPAARTIWVLWSFLPTLCSWPLLSYGVLAKSLSFPFPRPQFPNMGKSSQESWPLLPQSQNLWLSSKVFAILFFFFKKKKTGPLSVVQEEAVLEFTMG